MSDETSTIERMNEGEVEKAGALVVRVSAAAVGSLLTTVMGPEGSAAASEALAQTGEMAVGWIEQRRGGRIKRTLEAASETIAQRRASGETPRQDFADPENGDAAALFEAVVAAAADSAEDRKCAVLANLYADLAFENGVSIDDALLYVKRVRDSSWRQLVGLQYLADESRSEEREMASVLGNEGEARSTAVMAAEMVELAEALGLVGIRQGDGHISAPSATFGGGGFDTGSLAKWTPTPVGAEIIRLGHLGDVVSGQELDDISRLMAQSRC